jgi:hypothetical protein
MPFKVEFDDDQFKEALSYSKPQSTSSIAKKVKCSVRHALRVLNTASYAEKILLSKGKRNHYAWIRKIDPDSDIIYPIERKLTRFYDVSDKAQGYLIFHESIRKDPAFVRELQQELGRIFCAIVQGTYGFKDEDSLEVLNKKLDEKLNQKWSKDEDYSDFISKRKRLNREVE